MKFYATIWRGAIKDYMDGSFSYLLPASSWSKEKTQRSPRSLFPIQLPDHVTDVAADSGGFVATFKWGDYRYSAEEYVEWLSTFSPRWSATMDYCCEEEITGLNDGVIRERQDKSTQMAWHLYSTYRDSPWIWCPTIQGWNPEDYQRHAREMRLLIELMAQHYGPASEFRVGIGTLCRRSKAEDIRRVVEIVENELPGIPLHLWGVKTSVAKTKIPLADSVVSVDSAAWNGLYAENRHRWKETGMKQVEWCYKVALPRYVCRFYAAVEQGRSAVA